MTKESYINKLLYLWENYLVAYSKIDDCIEYWYSIGNRIFRKEHGKKKYTFTIYQICDQINHLQTEIRQ